MIYHCQECRYFINYIHRTSDVGRACVSTRRVVGWNARHEANRIPPPLLCHLLALSFSAAFAVYLFSVHENYLNPPATERETRREKHPQIGDKPSAPAVTSGRFFCLPLINCRPRVTRRCLIPDGHFLLNYNAVKRGSTL